MRLKPGVTREQAQQEISSVADRLEADYPETDRGRGAKLAFMANAIQQRGHSVAHTRNHAGRSAFRAADCVRERWEFAAGPIVRATT